MSSLVEAQAIGKKWGDSVALHPTDVSIEPGELVALVGHNGAGKTTLLALLAGVLEATTGEVTICGNQAGSIPARADLSYVPDTPIFYDDLSLIEHIEY
ncbi:MAG: ATP-binding cassette domain-containing protein, partial [Acidimicrobiia bacterium]